MALVVQCVETDQNPTDCRDIRGIGFPAESGGVAMRTPEEVYELIETGGNNVVVEHEGTRTDVIAVEHGTTRYVRSEPNDTADDNLLKQPSC